jgi:hypothetical protein
MLRICAVVVVLSVPAAAETRTDAIGVNFPLLGLSASGYVALTEHLGVRLNAARYKKLEGIDSEAGQHGYIFDAGAGVMWFPRRMMDGAHLEAGFLYREDQRTIDDDRYDLRLYALRGMAGWCWRLDAFFIDWAVGAATGIEHGTRPRNVHQGFEPEAYLRFGIAFDFR